MHHVIIDTNVLYSALWSNKGASHRLISLLGDERFVAHLSVPLLFEYEDVCKRLIGKTTLTHDDIDVFLDYVCQACVGHDIYYLWRPILKDPKDDLVLEIAVKANCDFILTYNQKDFIGCQSFGIQAITPKTFLQLIGDIA